jgi:hypothetical protein
MLGPISHIVWYLAPACTIPGYAVQRVSMPYLESLVLHVAIQVALAVPTEWGPTPIVLCDCTPAIAAREKGSSSDPCISQLVACGWDDIVRSKRHIEVEHVRTEHNFADYPSRVVCEEGSIVPHIDHPYSLTPPISPSHLQHCASTACMQMLRLSGPTRVSLRS